MPGWSIADLFAQSGWIGPVGPTERKRYLSKLHRRRAHVKLEQQLTELHEGEARAAQESAFGGADLWYRNGLHCINLCVVCSEHAASHMTGPHGVLSRTEDLGRASKLVAVHDRCSDRAGLLAQEQGYEWEYPPPPTWGQQTDR